MVRRAFRKSGHRLSEKIMLKSKETELADDSKKRLTLVGISS